MCRRWFSRDDEKRMVAEAAAQQRAAAEEAKQQAIQERAVAKREDISEALSGKMQRKGMRGGGKGRSLLMSQSAGAGFLGRFS